MCVLSMPVSVYVFACMCLIEHVRLKEGVCLGDRERTRVPPFCCKEVHQLGIGFILGGGLAAYMRKEGMERKVEWIGLTGRLGEVSYRKRIGRI